MTPIVPFVGLTGGMGAGKSTALAALERLGASVQSSDRIVHELYASDTSLRDAVVARWGERVVPAGVVDRSAVAGHAFSSDEERKWLEALLWPLVGARVAGWLEQVRASERVSGEDGVTRPRAAVIEVPLLFEAGLESIYDATIAVVSDEALRRQRADARGHVLADERAARQLSQQEKAQRATYVVRNDGSEQDLQRELSSVLDKLGR
ncbi:MAG TPA: dephospho-CoA kinase [Solirubrobacteraceae bacterium]|nr:dephospho-CoA kinase [Solirubrobacteraceae bacterium]